MFKAVDNLKAVLTKSATAWLIYLSVAANLVFEFGLGQTLPWWAIVALLGLILVGRVIKQEAVSGAKPTDDDEYGEALGV